MSRNPLFLLIFCVLTAVCVSTSGCRHQEVVAEANQPTEPPPPAPPSAPAQSEPSSSPAPSPMQPTDAEASPQQITLGAGCFWCIEAILERIPGVLEVKSGYMGGKNDNPTYEQICTGQTGHAEVVQVRFDPEQLSLAKLLDWFFQAHDPTTLNRQGPDRGTQYRSAIFYHDEGQREIAEQAKKAAAELYTDPIVTEITAAPTFWPAETYHQDFFANNPGNPYCRAWIPPKLRKLGLTDQDK